MPYSSDVHIDQALTNISIYYRNDEYVADQLFASVPVDKRSDAYFLYGREAFRKMDDLVRPRATAPEWDYTLAKATYYAERHAQRHLVTDDERMMSDSPLSPDIDATEILTDRIINNREFAILALVTSATQITQNVTLSGTSQWSDYTNSTPLTVIKTARTTVRLGATKPANVFAVGYEVAVTLADHPSVKDLVKYTSADNIADSGLPTTLRGLKVVEAGAFIDSSNEGQSPSLSTAFGKNALVAYVNPNPGLKTLSLGYVFEAPDATTGQRGFSTIRYRDDHKHGEWLEVATCYSAVLIAPNAGYLVQTAVA